MYKAIILGATFAAAGFAHYYKKDCLVVEASQQAGYEFFGTLQDYPADAYQPKEAAARALQETLRNKTVTYGSDSSIYPLFRDCHILFGTQVATIRYENGGFSCVLHGSQGFVTYRAKTVIDTRCRDAICKGKSYNFLMESPTFPAYPGAICKKTSVPNRYLVQCQLPPHWDFPRARQEMASIIAQFTPQQRLILSANVFDYQVVHGYPRYIGKILYMPSKAFDTPVQAMDAGLQVGGASL